MSQDGPGDGDRLAPEAPTEGLTGGLLSTGQVLGGRYQVRELLGSGGMGEVWHAFDLKLRVEVALKALREDLFRDEKRLEMLRSEVRAAREVVSPNVCRIFDLIEVDGAELVSMEYVDGETLLQVLQERGPLELKEAQDIASQFLAGLEAIHRAGLVHRDVKPENIMLTRAGRVVVMDFGLARQEDSGAGTVAGTPAYMAPEQAAGLKVDARADVYSAGVVLAEMVSPDGIKSLESRQSVWEGVRSEPAKLPATPWAPVLKRAVAKHPDQRYHSAHTLTRALEDVTLRVEGAEDLHPYPGLASFTEEDAEYFFGREAEVERMWRRLDRPHLLGIVGPSGSGKTSFIRAGVIPSAADDWAIVRCTPGNAALASLRRALAPEISDDPAAVGELATADADATVSAYSRWRARHGQTLLILDQFEELFTLNSAEEQAQVAELLSRLALEADVFVLLSMRDDFLMCCRDHEPLAPVFEDLTALPSLSGGALRRAVVQPATKCGYRFSDDELVEEMLAEVEGERGALPLLAFAMARLWEKRDRENGLLTRQAYHDIGGVGGALARHAEETIDRIGSSRAPIVRELFRNLVTAEGTRAVRDWEDLLSVFGAPQRQSAEEVLRRLIDARLLTSYEVHEEDRQPTRRVEIIHESLLANWPRLVGWRTRDADSARLRDELRQAARTWDEHGRHEDRLWTGTAYREFALWRERYPGGLTQAEEAFATAMTALASRRRRRRRTAMAAVLVISAAVVAVTTILWRRSVLHEHRAEAQKLVALGQLRLEDYPTAALAHAVQSLELADSAEARLLALEALWQGPTAFVVNEDQTRSVSFSPGGRWLVQHHAGKSSFAVIARDGRHRVLDHPAESKESTVYARFGGAEDHFISAALDDDWGRIGLWSAAEGRLLATARPIDDPTAIRAVIEVDAERSGALFAIGTGDLVSVSALLPDGRHEHVGEIRLTAPIGGGAGFCAPRAARAWIGVVEGNDVSVVGIGDRGLSSRRLLGRHDGELVPTCDADPLGRYLLTFNRSSGELKLWDATGDRAPSTAGFSGTVRQAWFSDDGSHFWLATSRPGEALFDVWIWAIDGPDLRLLRNLDRLEFGEGGSIDQNGRHFAWMGPLPSNRLWSLAAPAGAEPITLRCGPRSLGGTPTFSPDGHWLAVPDWSGLTLWPLARQYPAVMHPDAIKYAGDVAFGPDGRFLVNTSGSKVSLLPLDEPVPGAGRTLFETEDAGLGGWDIEVSRDGGSVAVNFLPSGEVWVGGVDGSEFRRLPDGRGFAVALSRDGRLVATSPAFMGADAGLWVWDAVTTERVTVLRLPDAEFRGCLSFTDDGRLVAGTSKGVVMWNVDTGDYEILAQLDVLHSIASDDGRRLLLMEAGEGGATEDVVGSPVYYDLDAGTNTTLSSHGTSIHGMALDRDGGVVVTSDRSGPIRVGLASGAEPHLLLGHDTGVEFLAVDPLGRFVASAGTDKTLRLWPMPDLSKPPLHTLPRQELIAKLKTLTNLRLVRDADSPTGWTLTHEPFQGWETAPSW